MSNDDTVSSRKVSEEPTAVDDKNSRTNAKPETSSSLFPRMFRRLGRLCWYLFKKAAYVTFIVAVAALLLVALDKLAKLALKQTYLAYVYPDDFDMARRDFTEPVSHYDYDLSPGVCILHNQVKGNRFEYTNNAGFRDPRPIELKKPDDEFRIFLTGGSTAFGLGAGGQAAPLANYYYVEHRETIAHVLERVLNTAAPIPGKQIRVYNAAVWGYAYQHLLFRYVTKLRQFKPDLIVSLDGVNELHAVSVPAKYWDYFSEGQFNGVLREMFSYSGSGLRSYLTLWLKNNTFLMTFLWRGTDPFFALEKGIRFHEGPAPGQDAKDANPGPRSEERSRIVAENVSAVVRVLEDYHSLLVNDGVPHIFALQPLLYLSKKPRHEIEKQVEALGEHKGYYDVTAGELYKFMIAQIADSAHKRQYLMADFSEYFDDTSEWVFTDWCHLTAGANYLIAKELANIIKEHFLQKTLSKGDAIEEKNSFFWNPAVKAGVVYAPPADGPDNGTVNMLTGYPHALPYRSKEVAAGERLEIVLDLGREFTLSRMRLVWDDDSVPDEWAMDISPDGENWKSWIQGTNQELDDFSVWPGYEFYGSEPVQARYLRYRPLKTDDRSIKIRSLNVYR